MRQKADRIDEDGFDAIRRWGTSELRILLRALEGRTAAERFCAVERINDEVFGSGQYVDRLLSPKGPQTLRQMRARERRVSERLVSFAELAAQLRAEIERNRLAHMLIVQATKELMEALRAEGLVARGQRDHPEGNPNPGAAHQTVPLEVLLHEDTTIELYNQLTISAEANANVRFARKGMMFSDVQFRTADILAIWPARTETLATFSERPVAAATFNHVFSLPHLRSEYRTRVERWKTLVGHYRAPSFDDDIIWAKKLFGNVPRATLRSLRNELAPKSWQKSGKRSGLIWHE